MSDHDIALMERARLREPQPAEDISEEDELRAVQLLLESNYARYRLVRARIVSAALVVMAEEGVTPEELLE